MKEHANELDGKTWLKYSISIWSDLQKSKEEVKLQHPAMFPSMLAHRLIECFTNKSKKQILDPFAGVGSTLVAAKELGKNATGIEISPEFVALAKQRIDQIIPYNGETDITLHTTDSRELYKFIKPESIDLVITSPPYWDILLRKRTADNKEQRDYGNQIADIGEISDYTEFLTELKIIFQQVYQTLKKERYCCIIVKDLNKGDQFYPFHMDVSKLMQELGYTFRAVIIWDRRAEYNSLRPLGYPYSFFINTPHEYILIFKKESK